MKKVFLGINMVLLWITIWNYWKFPITENMSLDLYNKKIYRRLIYNSIDPVVKGGHDLLFNINFSGEELDDAGRAYIKELTKIGDVWIGYVYSFDEIMDASPAYGSNPISEDEKVLKKYVDGHSGYFYVTSDETRYHLTKEEIMRKFNLKSLNFKNPKFYVDKFGTDRELSNWHKDNELPPLPPNKLKDKKRYGTCKTS